MGLVSRLRSRFGFPATGLGLIVLFGVVSLFSDMTYEGARSISGPFLGSLGASAVVVGVVAGAGEFLGYGLRLGTGYLSDRTGRYWRFTIAGYGLNLLAVPLLALAGSWPVAAVLLLSERTGKAIRTPARDTMLSHATTETGRGWGFGLHEFLDQLGAVSGPLLVAGVLAAYSSYHLSFALLLGPALIALLLLAFARVQFPETRTLEVPDDEVTDLDAAGFQFSRSFWVYVLSIGLFAAGFADFALVAFHFEQTNLVPDAWIPLLYALAMGVDAVAALAFGRAFDRYGPISLGVVIAVSAFAAPFVFMGGVNAAILGVTLWGAGMAARESVIRAAVADLVPVARRGASYGVFDTAYGLAWFLGSALMGVLYDVSLPALVAFSVGIQLVALPILFSIRDELS